MMWINQTGDGDGGAGGARSVRAPTPQDGVGDALRTAFLPRAHDLPGDIRKLIDRLR